MSLFEELKRRNVVRIAGLYVVASWVVLQVADVLFDALELPPVWMRFLLAILVIGFPITLVISWIYEMTPDGLVRDSEIDDSTLATRPSGRSIILPIVGLLVLVIAVMAVGRYIPKDQPADSVGTLAERADAAATDANVTVVENLAPKNSVAVLPFANRSALDEDVFFVDGIHDDILTQLARIGSLTVISRTSVEKFRNTTQSMQEIGAALGVRNIIEGGIQRAGDRVRINVQLIDVTTDDHLWANTYDHELTTANIFAIQSEVSIAVAEALEAVLSPEERQQLETVPTENMAALEAYFLGRRALAKRTIASLADAESQFKRAIDLDTDYALAYVGLADTYNMQARYSGLTDSEYASLAGPLVDRALAINNRLGEAYISKAFLVAIDTDRDVDVETLLRKGLDLAPNYATGHHWYGNFLYARSRNAEAMIQYDEAARLAPLSGIVKNSTALLLQRLARFEEAIDQYEALIRIDPGFARAHSGFAKLNWQAFGRLDDAIVSLRRAVTLEPDNPDHAASLAVLWNSLGDYSQADRWLNRTQAIGAGKDRPLMGSVLVKFNRGEFDEAVDDAEAALATRTTREMALWTLGLTDLAAGHVDAALTRYGRGFPELLADSDPVIDDRNFFAAVDFAYLLQTKGEDAKASALLDRILDYIQTVPRMGRQGYWIRDVRIFAMQGKNDRALAALREAVDAGWRVFWRGLLQHDPVLAELHDEPEYQAIVAELEADMVAQLKRVREMEASGELEQTPD